jgi:molybdopterin-guanine dinucleotide biosynthesis protein B
MGRKGSDVNLKLKSSHYIVDDQNRIVMAEGRMMLFEAIMATGCITQAAKQMGMSHKSAWSKLRSTEARLGTKVVHNDNGKGTRLTLAGWDLLKSYKQIKQQCISADDEVFDAHFNSNGTHSAALPTNIPPILSFVGHSGSGKTTLIEKLIPLFTAANIKTAVIKHDVHGFEMDKPGKDTWRHKKAGAMATIITSSKQVGMVLDTDHDHQPYELAPLLGAANLIIAEGFKRGPQAKIELFRPEATGDAELLCRDDPQLIAVVTDVDISMDLPVFGLNDTDEETAFIKRHFDLPSALKSGLSKVGL